MKKREHFKILITDPLVKEMVNQANKKFPEYALQDRVGSG